MKTMKWPIEERARELGSSSHALQFLEGRTEPGSQILSTIAPKGSTIDLVLQFLVLPTMTGYNLITTKALALSRTTVDEDL